MLKTQRAWPSHTLLRKAHQRTTWRTQDGPARTHSGCPWLLKRPGNARFSVSQMLSAASSNQKSRLQDQRPFRIAADFRSSLGVPSHVSRSRATAASGLLWAPDSDATKPSGLKKIIKDPT